MQDSATREKLKHLYGFALQDFLRLTGEQEMLLSETVKDKDKQILLLDQSRAEQAARAQQLDEICQKQESQLAFRLQMAQVQEAELNRLQAELNRRKAELESIFASRGWKVLQCYYRVRDCLLPPNSRRRKLIKILAGAVANPTWFIGRFSWAKVGKFIRNDSGNCKEIETAYAEWVQREEGQRLSERTIGKIMERFDYKPLISILLPVHLSEEIGLKQSVDSVLGQLYPNWQLCIVVAFPLEQQTNLYLSELAERDSRVKIVDRSNDGTTMEESIAAGIALEMSTGPYVGILSQSDELAKLALYEAVKLLNEHPQADMIYSDEDRLDEQGHRTDPHFKPDWSPELLLGKMYTGAFGIYRAGLVRQIGGFRPEFMECWQFDFVLRLTEQSDQIFHIPKVLYHRRTIECLPEAAIVGKGALEAALLRRGLTADVEAIGEYPGCYRIHYSLDALPLVSIVIPTRDMAELLSNCVQSILTKTQYPNYEIVIVDNGSAEEKTFALFKELQTREPERIRIVPLAAPFNYSQLNNVGAQQARGELLLFLNNDIEVLSDDWLTELAGYAMQSGIGAVGAKLLYPDYSVQHAGVTLGIGGVAGHGHKLLADSEAGYQQRLIVAANCSAVTGACLMIRRTVFAAVGGFDEKLAVAFNDIDFCLRIHQQGWRNVVLNYVRLIHHESKSRGEENNKEKQRRFMQEIDFMEKRWGEKLRCDPYYNPNLSLEPHGYSLKLSCL